MEEDRPNAAEGAAESDLHAAAWHGEVDEVRELVEAGAEVNWKDSTGETAIFGAAGWGHTEVVCYLLSVGAHYDLHEKLSGFTPLHWAAKSNVETIKALIEAGASPNVEDNYGNLPIDIAHQSGKGLHVAYLKTVGPEIASRRKRT